MRSPWFWIPTLYIAEGLPYFAVNTLTVLMYNNLGVGKAEMSFFTGWLYLPWVIKPFWSPFVDLMKTKRWWTLGMELLIALSMAGVAFLLPTGFYFSATLVVFWLMAFGSATHDIAADGYYMLELDEREQAAYVGVRSTFYRLAGILGQGGLVMLAGLLEQGMENVPEAWSVTFLILSIFFGMIFVYHIRFLPRAERDHPIKGITWRNILQGFGETFVTFFRKPYIWTAIAFMLLYRLPEALCIKMVQPFLVDSEAVGGLGLTTAQIGFVNGTIGVVALLAGGVVGGIAVARNGLKRWLWPMALSLTLPCLVYCYLAMSGNNDLFLVCSLIGVEQFGYGFGFTAFMLYLMYFSRGESQTSHYAFCTAFMALGMMIPGMFAGYLYEMAEGFSGFFWIVMASCVFTLLVTGRVYGTLERGPRGDGKE